MSILTPPASKYVDTIKIYKFNLSWKVFLYSSLCFLGLALFHSFYNNDNLIIALIASGVTFLSLLSLKITGKYNLTVAIVALAGLGINQYSIYTMTNIDRFIDVLWILNVGFFIFYTVGVFWGMLDLLINFIGLFGFLLFTPKEVLEHSIATKSFANEIDMIVNAFVSLTLVSYLLHRLLTEHRSSVQQLEKSNEILKQQKDELIKQNDEKTILLQEVHHRVKNNLQIISSLLRLQAGELDDPLLRNHFEDANNRVRSMALIHEKIYQNQNLANLDLKDYLTALTNELVKTYAYQKDISIHITTKNIEHIDIKALVPIALIFNELITNTLKHGFKDTNSGKISIEFAIDDNKTKINYSESGKWVSEKSPNGFGSILIETFTEQLNGEYELNTENGTFYSFVFENTDIAG